MKESSWEQLGGEDAYDLLGVTDDASPEQIVTAFRARIKEWHPDTSDHPDADKTRQINAAYRILRRERAAYDDYRSRTTETEPVPLPPEPWEPPDPWEEIPDDPWDEAPDDPWEEIPDDPWAGADMGPQPPSPVFSQGPASYPPPTSSGYPSMAPAYHPFIGRRRKIRWGCVLGLTSLLLLGCVAALVNSAEQSGPQASASVPGRFAGTWRGSVKDKGKDGSWRAAFTLHAGKNDGEVIYLGGACTGTAVPISYKAPRLRVSTSFPDGTEGCDVGDAYLSRRKDGRLDVVYYGDDGKVTASGVLARRSS
jgi:curved DNA-binding protein CbpA